MTELQSENLKIVALFKKNGKELSSLKFAEAKLKTGEVIMYDGETPVVGAAIAIQTAEGWLPVPDGTIELEDGTQIEVSGGLIANVKPAEQASATAQPTANPDENMDKEFTAEQASAVKRTVESVIKETHFSKEEIEAKFKEIPKVEPVDLTEINTKLATQESTITELKTQVSALIELLSKSPAETPAKVVNSTFKVADQATTVVGRDMSKMMELINSKK